MALTAAQIADVRRYAGYWLSGTTQTVDADNDTVYMVFGMTQMSLYTRLTTLSASEESVLVNTFLANISLMEAALAASYDCMDTAKAGIWEANPREFEERTALMNKFRRDMCAFLGLPPGPGLKSGANMLVRA